MTINKKQTYGCWSNQIPKKTLDQTIDHVVTGATVETITHSEFILNHIIQQKGDDSLTVLDFGCGVGRNLLFLSNNLTRSTIYAYDNELMLDQARALAIKKYQQDLDKIKNIVLTANWFSTKKKKFDFVYATLVFQHIKEDVLSEYLSDIRMMTDTLLVHGRRYNDDMFNNKHKNTWEILEKNGFYPTYCDHKYITEGDPSEHFTCLYKL